jgi:hypothetical protein
LTAEEKQKAAEQSATGKRINLKIGGETTRNQFSEQFAGPYFQRLEYKPLENGQHERSERQDQKIIFWDWTKLKTMINCTPVMNAQETMKRHWG